MANQGSSSTTAEVNIKLVADATSFRDELKKASSDANSFNKGMQDLKKAGIKQDKGFAKVAKDFNKLNKTTAKESEAHEKRIIALLRTHNKELIKLQKVGKQDTQEFKEKRAEAAKVAALYTSIRKDRAAIDQQNKPSALGKVGSNILSTAGTLAKNLALKAVGFVVGAMQSRVGTAVDADTQFRMNAINFLGDKGTTKREDLLDIMRRGKERGYDPLETMDQSLAVARATGSAKNVDTAQEFARSNMLDIGQATSFMGLQARGGGAANPAQGRRDLEKVMAAAVRTGMDGARSSEYLESLSGLFEGALSRSAGDVSAANAAQSLGILGGDNQSGLTGARGANVLTQLDQGFQGGGGEAGRAISLRAMGFGRGTSYYQAMKRLDQGFTGTGGAQNLIDYVRTVQDMYGGDVESTYEAVAQQTGVTRDIAEKVVGRVSTYAGQSPEELKKSIAAITTPTETLGGKSQQLLQGDLAEQAKIVAARNMEIIEQGQLLVDSTNKLTGSMNKLIKVMTPFAAKQLANLAEAAEGATDLLFSEEPKQYTKSPEESRAAMDPDYYSRRENSPIAGESKLLDTLFPFLKTRYGEQKENTEAIKELTSAIKTPKAGTQSEPLTSEQRN